MVFDSVPPRAHRTESHRPTVPRVAILLALVLTPIVMLCWVAMLRGILAQETGTSILHWLVTLTVVLGSIGAGTVDPSQVAMIGAVGVVYGIPSGLVWSLGWARAVLHRYREW